MYRILYIDDNIDNLELIDEGLTELNDEPKLIIERSEDPFSALKLIDKHGYDAFLIDVHLPKMSGFELYNKIRSNEEFHDQPIFFISSDETSNLKVQGLSLGADDFLSRAMPFEEMKARIITKIGKHIKNSNQIEIQVGPLSVCTKTMSAKYQNDFLDLTSIEFKLLYCLGISDKEFLTREELIKFVWNKNHHEVLPRTLNTHLSNLRKKVDQFGVKVISARDQGVYIKIEK
ncbi:MAG: response regulator transcription factor [Oligoflexia bacterium]|nr:response regulator transcription factor [Oligoflexia bacterium]